MDRPIANKSKRNRQIAVVAVALLALAGGVYGFSGLFAGKTKTVEANRLLFGRVEKAPFQESIAVTGTVRPLRIIRLDAIVGGRVEEKFVEEGALVSKDQPLLRLANPDLQLDFMNRQTALLDQLNNLRNTKLSLEQNNMRLREQLLDIENQYKLRHRTQTVNEQLITAGAIPKTEYLQSTDDYRAANAKKTLLSKSVQNDSVFQAQQNKQVTVSTALIEENLALLKEMMGHLIVRAPINGRLTQLNAEIGGSIAKNQNIGLIDTPEGYKVQATVDQLYLNRVAEGQAGEFILDGKVYRLTLKKIYPQVTNSQFLVDLTFDAEPPASIKPGQTLQVKILFSDSAEAVRIPRGAFFQQTGGAWIFVKNGKLAERREIKLGRQNPDYYEVLSGLSPNEEVVLSDYTGWEQAETLNFK